MAAPGRLGEVANGRFLAVQFETWVWRTGRYRETSTAALGCLMTLGRVTMRLIGQASESSC